MHRIAFAIAAFLGILIGSPVPSLAQVVITQAKALAGNVTPGDTAGFPVTLSLPGAYVMASNLTVPAGNYGFYITSNNVDLDMHGFLLTGGGGGYYGIVSHYYGEGRIHGGTISGFRSYGIYVRGNNWTIENMKIVRNGGRGIDAIDAKLLTVEGSVLDSNAAGGVESGDSGAFRNSTFSNNGGEAVRCSYHCHVEGNSVTFNGAGVWLRSGLVIGNTIAGNRNYGILDRSEAMDTGIANNMLIENNPTGTSQTSRIVTVHPNTCVGKPCSAP
jgi:hypothetical protein